MTGEANWQARRLLDGEDESALSQVADLADAHRKTLGFMPRSAIMDHADGRIIVAEDERGHVGGYLLYDLPRLDVRVVHLCVAGEARGEGVARLLVEELAEVHAGRAKIRLRCRNDYPAATLWPHLGFMPTGELKGRSKSGLPITQWERTLTLVPTLMDAEGPDRLVAALDTNSLLDLWYERDRPGRSQLASPWLTEHVEFTVTDQVHVELYRPTDPDVRARNRDMLFDYRKLHTTRDEVMARLRSFERALDRAGKKHDRDDLLHIAHADVAGADFLVTADEDLLSTADALDLTLKVHHPATLINDVFRGTDDADYHPAALARTRLHAREIHGTDRDQLLSTFLTNAHGETKSQLRVELDRVLESPHSRTTRYVVEGQQTPIALLSWRATNGGIVVDLIRASRHELSETVARHLIRELRTAAADTGAQTITIMDQHPGPRVVRALTAEAFSGNPPTCQIRIGVRTAQEWVSRPDDQTDSASKERTAAATFELRRWPAKVRDADLPCYLVPIKVAYAKELFDTGLRQQSLLAREEVGLEAEQVYFCPAVGATTTAEAPGRIAWYVPEHDPLLRVGQVRAVSHLSAIIVATPKSLLRRFGHLATVTPEQVRSMTNRHGVVMAWRFTNTELLAHPVSYGQLADMESSKRPPVRRPRRLTPEMFMQVYEQGSSHA